MNIKNRGNSFETTANSEKFISNTNQTVPKIICGLFNSYRSSCVLLSKLKQDTRLETPAALDFDSGSLASWKAVICICKGGESIL